MAKARQVATGNRRRVLEDGRDVVTSSDEDDPNMKPDELTGCYTAEMDPKAGPKVLTPAEAAFQRAAGKAIASQSKVDAERQSTPMNSDDDESWMNPIQKRQAEKAREMAARAVKSSAALLHLAAPPKPPYAERIPDPDVQAPAKGAPLEIKKKAAAPPRAPADQPSGAKAPPPTRGQQVPNQPEAGHHPMTTRKGSRPGGFRPGVGGSGQKDTRVASSHHSQT
jgi:hypothetical protein